MVRFNQHHTQFARLPHESVKPLKAIRWDSRLIVPLTLDVHEELHRQIPQVPVMSHNMGLQALKMFNQYGDEQDPIANLSNYMRSIEQAMKHPRAKELEKSVASLAIWACEQQIPFIKEGYVKR